MRTYEKYKDSGISWLGKVPKDWEVCKFKYTINIRNGKDYKDVQSDNHNDYPVYGSGGVFAYAKKYLYNGEALLLGRKGTIDKPIYIQKKKFWTVDTMFYGLAIKGNVCKYLYYQALTFPYGRYATSTALPSMTQSDLGNNPICLPSILEQQAIANYLDKKTAEIDKIIAEREKKIELLNELKSSIISRAVTKGINPHAKMKDSGIDWIGEIPEGWITTKLKYLLHLHNGRAYSQEELLTEGKYKVLRVGNFFTNDKWYYSNFELEPVKYCNKGDLLYAWSASFGPYIWDQDKTIYHYHIWKVTLEPSYNKKYAYYMLSALTEYKKSDVHGSTMVHVTMESMNNSFITLPPFQEQCEIARYLDEKLKRLSEISNDIISEISFLREYKQSLISEVVTGKRKVID